MTLNDNFSKAKNILLNSKSVVLTTHINPDGDALGSTLALFYTCKQLNIDVRFISYSPIPKNLKFLDKNNEIEVYNSNKHFKLIQECDSIFIMDLNSASRLKDVGDAIIQSDAKKVVIDHHLYPQEFADVYCMDYEACSAASIMFQFLKTFDNINIDKNIAEAIYTGIMTDTGSFRFERTTPEVHRDIALLLEKGLDPNYIYNKIFNESSFNSIKLFAKALDSMEIYGQGKICFMTLKDYDFKSTNTTIEETEGFVKNTLSLENVEIGGIFIEDYESSEVKISFRSKGRYSIREMAAEFTNGGGHSFAAGARQKSMTIEECKQKALEFALKNII